MRSIILLFGIMAISGAAQAADYEWTDGQGGLHFTDDLDKIPAKYRKNSREINVTPVINTPSQPQNQIDSPAARKDEASYGGYDESWWRSNFKKLHNQINHVQERIARERNKLAELEDQKERIPGQININAYIAYNNKLREINQDEAEVTRLQKEYDELDNKAARAAVPLEWRRE